MGTLCPLRSPASADRQRRRVLHGGDPPLPPLTAPAGASRPPPPAASQTCGSSPESTFACGGGLWNFEKQKIRDSMRKKVRESSSLTSPTSATSPLLEIRSPTLQEVQRELEPLRKELISLEALEIATPDRNRSHSLCSKSDSDMDDVNQTLADLIQELQREGEQARHLRKQSLQQRGVVPKLLRRRRTSVTSSHVAHVFNTMSIDKRLSIAEVYDWASHTARADMSRRVTMVELAEGQYDSDDDVIGSCVPEEATGLVPRDLHNYQLYCSINRINILLRPISQSAYSLYCGEYRVDPNYTTDGITPNLDIVSDMTFQEIKSITTQRTSASAKGIGVALKSSSYGPIAGLIPLNPQLSKSGVFSYDLAPTSEGLSPRSRWSPDDIKDGSPTNRGLSHLRNIQSRISKLRRVEGTNELILQKLEADYDEAMLSSDLKYEELLERYNRDILYTSNKLEVSRRYIAEFNQTQFLGKTHARDLQGRTIYYYTQPHPEGLHSALVVRHKDSMQPIFTTKEGDEYMVYSYKTSEFVVRPAWSPEYHWLEEPVVIMTHRKFFINHVTSRIEEGESDRVIPDYDGLSWSPDVRHPHHIFSSNATPEENIRKLTDHFVDFMLQRIETTEVANMGAVSRLDKPHIEEMRVLTEWRQNHGYECMNLTKTQPLHTGNYVAIESDHSLRILQNMAEVLQYYEDSWYRGVPHLLNPNWPVYVDAAGSPRSIGETKPLFDDTAEMSNVADRAKRQGISFEALKNLAMSFQRQQNDGTISPVNKKGCPEVVASYVRLEDQRKVMKAFWDLRALLIYPPLVLAKPSELEEMLLSAPARQALEEKRKKIDQLMPYVVQSVQERREELEQSRRVILRKQLRAFKDKYGDVVFIEALLDLVDEGGWDEGGCVIEEDSAKDTTRRRSLISHYTGNRERPQMGKRRSLRGQHEQPLGSPRVSLHSSMQHSFVVATGLRKWVNRAVLTTLCSSPTVSYEELWKKRTPAREALRLTHRSLRRRKSSLASLKSDRRGSK